MKTSTCGAKVVTATKSIHTKNKLMPKDLILEYFVLIVGKRL